MGWREVMTVSPLVVVVSGQPNTGLFVYNGKPKAGNPPVFAVVAPGNTSDPFGNSLPLVGSAPPVLDVGNLAAGGAHIGIDAQGDLVAHAASGSEIWLLPGFPAELIYDSTGMLVASIASAGGTDASGNVFLAGVTSYFRPVTTFYAASLQHNQLTFFSSPTAAGPWSALEGSIGEATDGTGNLQIAAKPGSQILLGNATAITAAGAGILTVTETSSGPGSPPVQLIGQSAGDRSLGIEVAGDTSFRLRVDTAGKHDWGPGNATVDTTLYRASAGLLGVSELAADISGSPETWHSLGALGAHYTVTRGRYRLTPLNELEVDIEVVGDGLQATSVTFANTLPALYRPPSDHTAMPMGTTRAVNAGDIWPRLTVTAAGAVTVINAGTASTFAATQRIPLD